MRRRSRSNGTVLGEVLPVIKLWLLRILIPLGGHREFITQQGFKSDALAETLGLSHWVDPEDREFNLQTVRVELRGIHRKVERSTSANVIPDCLRQNVIRLAGLIGLSETDCRIFEFATLIHNERLLDDTADFLGHLSSVKVAHALSVILDLPESAIRTSLSSSGVLASSGLVSMDRSGTFDLKVKLDFMRPDQAWDIYAQYCQQQNLAIDGEGLSQRVRRLHNLAPGDFAAVMRQSRFRPFGSANEFLTALESECALKEGTSTRMGFIH